VQRFYGEEISTDPRQVKPQHLAPGDAMVFNQVVGACSADAVVESDPVEVVARWQTPAGHEDREVAVQSTLGELLGNAAPHLAKGVAIVAYAEALKASGEAQRGALQKALAQVQAANPAGDDVELGEIGQLIERYLELVP
jgi:Ca-activated chloride channel family protein